MLKAFRKFIRRLWNRKFYRLLDKHRQELFEDCLTICTFSKCLAADTRMGTYLTAWYKHEPIDDYAVEEWLKPVVRLPTVIERRNFLLAAMIQLKDVPAISAQKNEDLLAVNRFSEWMGWGGLTGLYTNTVPHYAQPHEGK